MLDVGGHALGLHRPHIADGDASREIGILAIGFKDAPAERVTVDVEVRSKHHADAKGLGLFGHGRRALPDEIGIPRRGHQDAGWEAGGHAAFREQGPELLGESPHKGPLRFGHSCQRLLREPARGQVLQVAQAGRGHQAKEHAEPG